MDAKSNFEKQADAGQKSEEQLVYERVCRTYNLDPNVPKDVIKFIQQERSHIHRSGAAEDDILNDMKLARQFAKSIQSKDDGAEKTQAKVITPEDPVYVDGVEVSSLIGYDEDQFYDSSGKTYNNSPAREPFLSRKA